MGDAASGRSCAAFVNAFADDIIKKFRSEFLDLKFEDQVRYYVAWDEYPTWEVHLYAAIKTGVFTGGGKGKKRTEVEAHFRVESAPTFYPTSDSFVAEVRREFPDLPEAEIERRLEEVE
jgi:hypothetical protein